MDKLFNIVFLDEAFEYLRNLEKKHYEKILFNIRKAQTGQNPDLFKKLKDEIWEFRTLYQGVQYRMLAFWDKTDLKILWLFQLMVSLRSAAMCLTVKSIRQNSIV